MKKKVFSLVFAMVLVMLPLTVNAADFTGTIFGSEDEAMTKTTLNNATITCPKSADGKTATCYIGIRVTSGTAKNVTIEGTLTNMTYDDIEMMGNWDYDKTPQQSGNNITFSFSNKTGTTAGNQVLMAKVTYTVNNTAQNCGIKFNNVSSETPTPTPEPEKKPCRTEDGKYYCKDANECTKAEYETQCIPENPQTGSVIPYVVVLGGLGVAGALYFVTRKKAKIYHV